jgi:hypothetical protein
MYEKKKKKKRRYLCLRRRHHDQNRKILFTQTPVTLAFVSFFLLYPDLRMPAA